MWLSWIFIFGLFCISSVISENKLCDINDSKCLTESAARRYVQFISGLPGVEPSDPLHLDLLEVNLPSLNYKIINGSLSGIKNCRVDLVQLSPNDKKYHGHIGCPHLLLESRSEVKGKVGPEFIEGKGTSRIFFFDYNLLLNGDFEKEDGNDKNIHIQLKNCNVEVEAKGKVYYDFDNFFNGNKAKSDAAHKFVNENWHYVDKLSRQPAMEAFMEKLIDNVNTYLRKVPVQDLFSEDSYNNSPFTKIKL